MIDKWLINWFVYKFKQSTHCLVLQTRVTIIMIMYISETTANICHSKQLYLKLQYSSIKQIRQNSALLLSSMYRRCNCFNQCKKNYILWTKTEHSIVHLLKW